MHLKLGVNTGFALNRYQEPESWGRIIGMLNVKSVQLTAGLINPFWQDRYLSDLMERIAVCADQYGFTIDSVFTDALTRVNHLSNPDEAARSMWLEWFKKLFRIGAKLGATSGGSHFGSMTFDTYNDEAKRARMTEATVKGWQELSKYAKELGFTNLFFEPMSVPREYANTVAETLSLMNRVNEDCGVPMRVCLDIGHAPHPDERDCYPWLRALGNVSPIIHLQQTQYNRSNHWPFTEEYNAQGYITGERVIEALQESGCKETTLILELAHREHWDTDFRVVEDHAASAAYWRKFVTE